MLLVSMLPLSAPLPLLWWSKQLEEQQQQKRTNFLQGHRKLARIDRSANKETETETKNRTLLLLLLLRFVGAVFLPEFRNAKKINFLNFNFKNPSMVANKKY